MMIRGGIFIRFHNEVVNNFKGFPFIENEAKEIVQIAKLIGEKGFFDTNKEKTKDLTIRLLSLLQYE